MKNSPRGNNEIDFENAVIENQKMKINPATIPYKQ